MKSRRKPLSAEHKRKISEALKGRPSLCQHITDEELIELVAALGRTTAAELAGIAGIAYVTACARLRRLWEEGKLDREKRHVRLSRGRPSWVYRV